MQVCRFHTLGAGKRDVVEVSIEGIGQMRNPVVTRSVQ